MYCPICGADGKEAKFCYNCGARISETKTNNDVETFTLISAYKSMFKKYAQFSGRSRRSEYWLAYLMNTIIAIGLYLIMVVAMFVSVISSGGHTIFTMVIMALSGVLMTVYAIVILVPSLAMTVRRLHDIGKSGWFLLLELIPYVGGLILLVFSVLDSQPGENQYGPNPKGE